MGTLAADLRAGWRALRAAPGHALAVVACLALGLGANAAVLGVLDALLFRPPPGVADAGRVARVDAGRGVRGMPGLGLIGVTPAERDRLAARARSVAALAAYRRDAVTVGRGADARPGAPAVFAAPGYWAALGARPALGRAFAPPEEAPGGPVAAVVSDRLWRAALGADPRAVGRALLVNGVPARVVGVAAPGFAGVDLLGVDVWLPLTHAGRVLHEESHAGEPSLQPSLTLAVRLRGGVRRADAEREVRALLGRPDPALADVAQLLPPTVRLAGLRDGDPGVPDDAARLAGWLAAVSALVLLVAAANVAGLTLARGVARRRGLAIRLALGVRRARLVRQLVAEAALLTAAAGAASVAVAAALAAVLRRYPAFPVVPPFDARQAAVVLALAVPLVAACGLAPALASTRASLLGTLHDGARATAGRARAREQLLVAQLALTVVLVAGAGLFLRSLHNALTARLGFDATHLVAVTPVDGGPRSGAAAAAAMARLRERAAALPGVRAASITGPAPFTGAIFRKLEVPGSPAAGRKSTFLIAADEHTLAALGVGLVRGRGLAAADRPADDAAAPAAVLVNEAMARRDWPGRDPLGACVRFVDFSGRPGGASPCVTVVGVVRDARLNSLSGPVVPAVYEPTPAGSAGFGAVLVRLAGPADAAAAAAVRRALAAAVPEAPPLQARTVAELLGEELNPQRLGATLFTLYGALALALAAVGLYGVTRYNAERRTRELAVRTALGARPGDLARLVLGGGARLAAAGVVFGTAAALAASRLLTGLLYGVEPADPGTLAAACALLAAVALLASWLPARRAARADPSAALRAE